jgi:hypothetical protein
MLKRIKGYVHKNEKNIAPIALIGGFIVDNITLSRADILPVNILFIVYLIIVFSGVAIMRYSDTQKPIRFYDAVFAFTQFSIGALFSMFTVLYSSSGSWVSSWPFLIVLLGFMISSEFMKKYYAKFMLQIIVVYLCLFSYLIFSIPLLTKSIGPNIFIFSGLISLAIMWPYVKFVGDRTNWRGILATYALITVFYFLHVIPPIPLSLTKSQVSSYINRVGNDYVFAEGVRPWYAFLPIADRLYIAGGSPVYFYSSVFSPTDIDTDIIHNWQYFDESKARWISVSRIRFPIIGGRVDGYRGYSVKSNVYEGMWRVDVETEYGQLIGRKRFEIEYK